MRLCLCDERTLIWCASVSANVCKYASMCDVKSLSVHCLCVRLFVGWFWRACVCVCWRVVVDVPVWVCHSVSEGGEWD